MQCIKEAVKLLEKQKIFLEYKKNNPESFLLNAFATFDDKELIWQLNYYNPIKKNLVIFTPLKKEKSEEQKLFKESKNLQELNLKEIKIEIKEALNLIKTSSEKTIKKIITIHTIKNKTIWNFIFLTSSFKTLNIKLNASSGKIISKKLIPMFAKKS
ncbi:MAG: hypothetical protein KKG75_04975 [Nanoarchaeota archaeon]|nr:hypothetical protein [Nanoarchaeota archaeon]